MTEDRPAGRQIGPAGSPVDVAARRLGRPVLAPLVDELADRFADGPPATLSLRRLDDSARSAVADLLGAAKVPPATGRLPIARLLDSLGLPDVAALRAAVESVRGPIDDRTARRAAAAREREAHWRWFDSAVADRVAVATSADAPVLADLPAWAARVRGAGVRGGVGEHRRRLERVLAVLDRLPADGLTLASLAADVCGDPHGLDRGRSVAALVLDALDPGASASRDAEAMRTAWERAGVAPDALSSSVLVLGLTADDDHPLAGYLRLAARASEPVVLTLAQLRRWPVPPLASSEVVFVVENPSVVAAASQQGWAGHPPLVCSSGRPTVAVVTVVRQLASAGARVYQHADFDVTGVAITAWLAQRAGTVPWHMGSDDYRSALGGAPEPVPLTASVPPTPWDPALSAAMTDGGVAVYEEQLRTELLDAMTTAARA